MKTKRRAAIKTMVASAAGLAGAGLAQASGTKSRSAIHEAGGVVRSQDIPVFSANTKYENLVFISGIGCKEGPSTIKNHAKVVMRDLQKAIEAAGSSMDKVLRCCAYVDDIKNVEAMNRIYDAAWPKGKMPARTCIAVAKGGIPAGSLCEVDAICYI